MCRLRRMVAVQAALAAVVAVACPADAFDPYVAGPHRVGHTSVNPLLRPDLPVTLSVSAPQTADVFPMVLFLTSFQDIVPAAAQSQLLERIASHGLVVVTAWSLTESGGPDGRALKLEQVMDWIHQHLPNYLHQHHFPGLMVDFNRTTLLGHSAGAHIAVSYLERQCDQDADVKALALVSPVDGVDPFGIVKDYCITPGQKVNFSLPTLVLTAGLDAEKGFPLFPACAPAELSNNRFYDAFSGPRWQINATQFGHADFWDDDYWNIVQETKFCASCAPEDCANRDVYRNYVAGQIISFAMATTEPTAHCDQLTYLEDSSLHPVSTVTRSDRPAEVCSHFMASCQRP